MKSIHILGQIKSSFIDYPSNICTVIFLGGCNFNCGYCHNPDIVRRKGMSIKEEDFFKFLEKRKKYLDGVCISGGEPTLYESLCEFIQKIRSFGYKVKLDTNGTNPKVLKQLMDHNWIDYIAMDLKAPLRRYTEITGTNVNIDEIQESIEKIMVSDIDYEFRTTIAKEILSKEDINEIIKLIPNAKRYCIQNFRKVHEIIDNDRCFTPYKPDELNDMKEAFEGLVHELIIR
ncbi:MAG: anaerobic ribonucleoside-triphosphate reductase activating protein [Clostridia bacterium]|nr:anaerobic ribonucleoside-triphosphate reductase activating protein [Clostridia bacterium]